MCSGVLEKLEDGSNATQRGPEVRSQRGLCTGLVVGLGLGTASFSPLEHLTSVPEKSSTATIDGCGPVDC